MARRPGLRMHGWLLALTVLSLVFLFGNSYSAGNVVSQEPQPRLDLQFVRLAAPAAAAIKSSCPPDPCVPGNQVGRDFFVEVVALLGDVPMSNFAVDALVVWEPWENTLACWNPLATTQRLSAIRKLAREAADNRLIPMRLAAGIEQVKGVRASGRRLGNWLTVEEAQELLERPDIATLKGLRDRAILAVLLGGGLRRAEAARLTVGHVQQREGRWVLADIQGKGQKVRTVPIPSWAKVALDAWTEAAGICEGLIFRAVNKGDRINGESMTDQAIYDVVREYAGQDTAAHDLRRTFAKLAHKGGAGLYQIQLTLGHASIATTERYLGLAQDLTDAPCDRLGLRLAG